MSGFSQQSQDSTRPWKLPLAIFSTSLSPLEATVMYLRRQGCTFACISQILRKQPSTISTTYYNAQKKQSEEPIISPDGLCVPTSIFASGLATLEAVSLYLQRNRGLRIVNIAKLLGKDNKVIWTSIQRAKKKFGDEKVPEEGELVEEIEEKKKRNEIDEKRAELKTEIIPLDIFAHECSPLEAMVAHLKNQYGYSYAKIARLLSKHPSTIATSYQHARKKSSTQKKDNVHSSSLQVHLADVQTESLSVLEAVVHFLSQQGYRVITIAHLLGKDNKVIWTTKKRADEKIRRCLP